MIRHVVAWNFVATDPEERTAAFEGMKQRLEPLVGVVPGLQSLELWRDLGESDGNRELVLVSDHDDADALAVYQTHPAHVEAAGFTKSVTRDRVCVDYEV
jgi:heme-degrading monooxygenase HmoA